VKLPRRNKRKGFWAIVWQVLTDPKVIAALIGLAAAIVTTLGRK